MIHIIYFNFTSYILDTAYTIYINFMNATYASASFTSTSFTSSLTSLTQKFSHGGCYTEIVTQGYTGVLRQGLLHRS